MVTSVMSQVAGHLEVCHIFIYLIFFRTEMTDQTEGTMRKEDVGDDTGRFRITVGSFVLALAGRPLQLRRLPPATSVAYSSPVSII